MKRVFTLCLVASLVLLPFLPSSANGFNGYSSTIAGMVAQVSEEEIIAHICHLQDADEGPYCNEDGSRYSYNTVALTQAADYIQDRFKVLGLDVTLDPFTLGEYTIYNVVATLPGAGSDIEGYYVICAHYDSISDAVFADPQAPAPGADDNASGTAAMLEAARVLSAHRFAHTIRFIAFAGEEQGLWGSRHYASEAAGRGDHILGVINLDMVAWDSDGDRAADIHCGDLVLESSALGDAVISAISRYDIALTPEKITAGAIPNSDHAPFWYEGYPALLLIEDLNDFNPHYHTTRDVLAYLDTSFATEFTRTVVATIAELAALTDQPAVSYWVYLPFVQHN